MLDPAKTSAFQARLEAIKNERGDTVSVDEIGDVVASLLRTLSGDLTPAEIRLYRELDDLVNYIRMAKSEIAAIHPEQIRSDFIERATDELDAIVKATETATSTILDCAEALEALTGKVPAEQGQAITDVVTRIYEASSFQDLTGQRVTKVVNALQHIEIELDKIVKLFGDELRKSVGTAKMSKPDDQRADAHLLNGPQLSGQGASQAEIDALLADM
ncbi:MAG: protein phosphatase CheZ [Alphaproteobacteria bacterium]